jgi:hypothetical protein
MGDPNRRGGLAERGFNLSVGQRRPHLGSTLGRSGDAHTAQRFKGRHNMHLGIERIRQANRFLHRELGGLRAIGANNDQIAHIDAILL